MYGRCETDPFDQAIDVCGSCYGEFCQTCLVAAKGKKLPVCKECTVIASGVRPGAKPLLRGSKKTAQERRQALQQAGPAPPPIDYFDEAKPAPQAAPSPAAPPPAAPPPAAPSPAAPSPAAPPPAAPSPGAPSPAAPIPAHDMAPPPSSEPDLAPTPPTSSPPTSSPPTSSPPTSSPRPDRGPTGMAALARYKAEAAERSAPGERAEAPSTSPNHQEPSTAWPQPHDQRPDLAAAPSPSPTTDASSDLVAAGRGWSVQLPQPGSTGLPARRRGDHRDTPATNDQGPEPAPALAPSLPRRRSRRRSDETDPLAG